MFLNALSSNVQKEEGIITDCQQHTGIINFIYVILFNSHYHKYNLFIFTLHLRKLNLRIQEARRDFEHRLYLPLRSRFSLCLHCHPW